ncbi:hypothetical protein N7490_008433 [Penicillium lividum]|nr:hypothetical protein N7490_008433 [Penicillium lividum]
MPAVKSANNRSLSLALKATTAGFEFATAKGSMAAPMQRIRVVDSFIGLRMAGNESDRIDEEVKVCFPE